MNWSDAFSRIGLFLLTTCLWLRVTGAVWADEKPVIHNDRPLHELIDEHIESGWTAKSVQAAEMASDAAFLRRVTLDLTGVVPTSDDARAFLNDDSPNKRQRLIGQLLDSPEYRRGENVEWGGVRDLAFSPDGSTLACCGRHKYAGPATVLLFDPGTEEQTEKLVSTFKAVFHQVTFHPDGFLITAGGAIKSGELWLWNPKDKKPQRDKDDGSDATDNEPLAKIELTGPANSFDLHPDGAQIAVAHSTGKSTYPDAGAIGVYRMSARESE